MLSLFGIYLQFMLCSELSRLFFIQGLVISLHSSVCMHFIGTKSCFAQDVFQSDLFYEGDKMHMKHYQTSNKNEIVSVKK